MSDVVVDITQRLCIGHCYGSLKAVESHVVLGGIEAAKADVVPNLAVVDAALDESPVESDRHFRLVGVEVVRSNRSNSLNVVVVELQHFLVDVEGLTWIVQ